MAKHLLPSLRTDEERNRLAERHAPLIWHMMDKYDANHPGQIKTLGEPHDTFQNLFMVLMRAAELWKPEKGAFSTYACCGLYRDIMRMMEQKPRGTLSYDVRVRDDGYAGSGNDLYMRSTITDPKQRDVALGSAVRDLLFVLSPRERRMVEFYYFDGHTMPEIGKMFGIAPSRVQQIIARALKRMRCFAQVA